MRLIKLFSALGVVVITLLWYSKTQTSFAQSKDDYISTYSNYRDTYTAYLKARQTYLQFGTLKAKSEAESATQSMLSLRSQTLIAYLKLLKNEIGSFNPGNSTFFLELEKELDWQASHLNQIKDSTTLEPLLNLASQFKEHYEKITTNLTLLAIVMVNYNQLSNYQAILNKEVSQVAQLVSPESTSLAKNVLEAQSALKKSQEIYESSIALILPNLYDIDPDRIKSMQKQIANYQLQTADYLIEIKRGLSK